MKLWLSLILFTFLIPHSYSQEIGECISIKNASDRLSCYDEIASYSIYSDQNSETNWEFVSSVDRFTDKDNSYLYLASAISSRRGDHFPKALVIRCDGEGDYDIYMVFSGYVGNLNDQVPVQYRFGSDEPIQELWNVSTDGGGAFLPKRYNDFKSNLLLGKDFIFQATDYQGTRAQAEFDNSLDQNFEFILNGCR